ncbi:MAG: asparaginase [Candidatus Marinimicrobia bacterium]|nr:asparaginase [Candidatus Neomarinimicrobiota bacterium]
MTIPKLIIHGGAGSLEGNLSGKADLQKSLNEICKNTYKVLLKTNSYQAVLRGICYLENNQLFNAGTGSKLQSDGRIRMSAGIMDGNLNKFSGVINIQKVKNPILIADHLQKEKHTVIADNKATLLARNLGFPVYNPLVEKRWNEYIKNQIGNYGTVGVVALDSKGNISAGTSTGGIGGETPGRVSDSPTVAGNYANKYAGVSATGVGEQIINSGVATKIVTRVEDGLSLKRSVNKTINEAKKLNYKFGVIGISYTGEICVEKTTDTIFYAWHDGKDNEVFH